MMPPELAVLPSPVMVTDPPMPLSMMPLTEPLLATLWKVAVGVMPASDSAVPVVLLIVLPAPETVRLPAPVAPNPVPDVVAMASPPFENTTVDPAWLASVTAGFAPVLSDLVAPLNVTVPPLQSCTTIPSPVLTIGPEN